ncbi:MAG: DUF1705 domain-containing protein, partial [Candidatus Electrothrix sp. AUS4]|nr:DUF1705 domain-containing protein [Candidatus Electrothrix sp. AUS4]
MISNSSEEILEKKHITTTQLILLVSLFFILFANITFFRHIIVIYPFVAKNFIFLASLVVGSTCAIGVFLTLITSICPPKPVLILFLLVSSVAAYFMDTYDLVIDHVMIQNIVETNWDETSDLLNLRMVGYFVLLGMLPSYFV